MCKLLVLELQLDLVLVLLLELELEVGLVLKLGLQADTLLLSHTLKGVGGLEEPLGSLGSRSP